MYLKMVFIILVIHYKKLSPESFNISGLKSCIQNSFTNAKFYGFEILSKNRIINYNIY